MKKPYLKKYGDVAGFTVWIVDGKYVRTHFDNEFTNYGQHYRFNFIPKKEFWIDRHKVPGEEKFYVSNLLVENRLMAKGVDYKEAVDKANAIEKRERLKESLIKKKLEKKRKIKEEAESVHKKLLKKYSKHLKVWIVSGRLIRDLFFIDFVGGGHDKVYDFIPEGEIWIEDNITANEIKFILLHELFERNLMAKGMEYDPAHAAASGIEYYCRHHEEVLDKKIKQELKKAEKKFKSK